MSMVAIFHLPCCDQEMTFGYFRGGDMAQPAYTCKQHSRQPIKFVRYVDEKLNGITESHAWRIPRTWRYDEETSRYVKVETPKEAFNGGLVFDRSTRNKGRLGA